MKLTADEYIIVGTVEEGKHTGETVAIYWSPEGGGWWQWGPIGWATPFAIDRKSTNERFKDAINTALSNTWCGGCGPWFYKTDPTTVRIAPIGRQALKGGE